jgi:hypothetical protein
MVHPSAPRVTVVCSVPTGTLLTKTVKLAVTGDVSGWDVAGLIAGTSTNSAIRDLRQWCLSATGGGISWIE